MQYTVIFISCENDNFQSINIVVFVIFAQNIDCGYKLEPPHSNEYPQSFFRAKIRKNVYPCKPQK